jgi:hypothetical protein
MWRRRYPIDTARERAYSWGRINEKDMTPVKLRYCWLLAAVALFSGCGKEERMEAVRFCKTLQQKSADFASANAMEKDFVASGRSWCGSVIENGSGRGDQLKQNMAVAKDLVKSAQFISTQVGAVRQAVYDEPVKQEYPQSIRVNLITQLTKRQRFLQEARALLDDTGPGFLELGLGPGYKGDSYPDSIPKLNVLLEGATSPADVVGAAIQSLKTKYDIQDADLK